MNYWRKLFDQWFIFLRALELVIYVKKYDQEFAPTLKKMQNINVKKTNSE